MECFINIHSINKPKTPIYLNDNGYFLIDDYNYSYNGDRIDNYGDDIILYVHLSSDIENLYTYVMYVSYLVYFKYLTRYLIFLNLSATDEEDDIILPNNIIYLRIDANINNYDNIQYYINTAIPRSKIYARYLVTNKIRDTSINSCDISNYLKHVYVYCFNPRVYENVFSVNIRLKNIINNYYDSAEDLLISVLTEVDYVFMN